MTLTRTAAITYDGLPIASGGAHALRTRGLDDGFDALQSFADAVSLDPAPVNLVVEVMKGKGIPERFTSLLGAEFNDRLAPRAARRVGDCTSHQWSVASSSLQWVMRTLEQFRPIPKTKFSGHAALVHATWNLVLFDSSHRPLPYQGREHYLHFDCDGHRFLGQSFVYGRISEHTTANLFLSLPYDDVNGEVQRVVRQIQAHFPAPLSSSHWKMWRLAKNGQRYVGRKMSAPL